MKTHLVLSVLASVFFFSGCSEKKALTSRTIAHKSHYGSGFPAFDASGEIARVISSVKKVYCVSNYTTYQFKREAKVTSYHLRQGTYKKAAWGIISTHETIFGTATVIGNANSSVALLTCAHNVSSPDTLITFFEPTGEDPSLYLQSFSIKENQEIWIKELSRCGSFNVLATDLSNDIAFLGKKCENGADTVNVFSYPTGSANELTWGNFVYVFGYPMGNPMITKGIVSPAPKRPKGEFSIDALLNKGYSGGIIVAIRGDTPGFELVGMVKEIHTNNEIILRPAADNSGITAWLPYKGEFFTANLEQVQYGLNRVVPVESIVDFYMLKREELAREGFNLDHFFNLKTP